MSSMFESPVYLTVAGFQWQTGWCIDVLLGLWRKKEEIVVFVEHPVLLNLNRFTNGPGFATIVMINFATLKEIKPVAKRLSHNIFKEWK